MKKLWIKFMIQIWIFSKKLLKFYLYYMIYIKVLDKKHLIHKILESNIDPEFKKN